MTATYAVFEYESLSTRKYDLIVFDEASQVSKAHAIALSELGHRVLFAGDPRQLSPIVQAGSEDAQLWLGRSPFDWSHRTNQEASCMLDEQWRMAEPISRAVSSLFYQEKLRVAAPALLDPRWLGDRTAIRTQLLPASNVILLNTMASAEPAKEYVGYVCRTTAELAAAIALDLHGSCPGQTTLILTPYRAQRRTIHAELQGLNLPTDLASTVHRAQGSERRNVIVDMVKAGADFVNGPEGRRLINVALSRAECRVVILLQMDWRENPVLVTLSSIFPITNVDYGAVSKVLLKKLPAPARPAIGTVKASANPAPSAPSMTLIDEFHLDLLQGLRSGPQTADHRKWFARELSERRKYYKKLTFSEQQRAMDRALDDLRRN